MRVRNLVTVSHKHGTMQVSFSVLWVFLDLNYRKVENSGILIHFESGKDF